ncbi:MAG: SIMPL domain-containing protein [Desulfobacterales bacterium]
MMKSIPLWAVVGLSFLMALTDGAGAAETEPPGLEVVGRSAVAVQPDTAVLVFAVETNRPKAADAVAENAQKAEALLSALKSLMASGDRLQTSGYTVHPVYDSGERLRPSGYRAANRVTLETRRIDRTGDFIDAAAEAGAGRMDGLQFKSSREAEAAREAATQAVREARMTAESLAAAAGVSIRSVRRIRYVHGFPTPVIRAEMMATRVAATPIEPGDIPVEAEVSVTFDIE